MKAISLPQPSSVWNRGIESILKDLKITTRKKGKRTFAADPVSIVSIRRKTLKPLPAVDSILMNASKFKRKRTRKAATPKAKQGPAGRRRTSIGYTSSQQRMSDAGSIRDSVGQVRRKQNKPPPRIESSSGSR